MVIKQTLIRKYFLKLRTSNIQTTHSHLDRCKQIYYKIKVIVTNEVEKVALFHVKIFNLVNSSMIY